MRRSKTTDPNKVTRRILRPEERKDVLAGLCQGALFAKAYKALCDFIGAERSPDVLVHIKNWQKCMSTIERAIAIVEEKDEMRETGKRSRPGEKAVFPIPPGFQLYVSVDACAVELPKDLCFGECKTLAEARVLAVKYVTPWRTVEDMKLLDVAANRWYDVV